LSVDVVVSVWSENPGEWLAQLVASIDAHPAGADFELVLCANGEDFELPAQLRAHFDEVFVRPNVGFNIGAWEHAWRRRSADSFLFLQDDCVVLRRGWLADFQGCLGDSSEVGLVGEHKNRTWDRTWDELCSGENEKLAERARRYKSRIESWGVDAGECARHLTTVVQFTSRTVLEEVDGFPIAREYEDAIAAEIAFSRKVEASGRALAQVGRRRHSRIGHREWEQDGFLARLRRSARKRLR